MNNSIKDDIGLLMLEDTKFEKYNTQKNNYGKKILKILFLIDLLFCLILMFIRLQKEVKSIELINYNPTMFVGEKQQLNVKILPTNASNKTVTWTSSNPNIATVTNGVIDGIKDGTVTITAKTSNGRNVSIMVIIKEILPAAISLRETFETINEGESKKIMAIITPSNTTNKTVTWTSSDPSVATVENGVVKGIKSGTVTITAKSNNGKEAVKMISVIVPVTEVTINCSNSVNVDLGSSITLTAIVSPSNATNKTVTWTSSDPSVATVTNGVIEGINVGTVTITARTNNDKIAVCQVTVKKGIVDVTKIELNVTSKVIYINNTYTLYSNITPSNATNKAVTWTSSDPSIAPVTNGVVRGIKAGTVTITARTNNGKTATSSITVKNDTFTIPIANGADPWMIQKDGYYYTLFTSGRNTIVVYKSKNLHELSVNNAKTIYVSNNNQAIWAPELHYLNNKWYVYYADAPNNNAHNRKMYVLRSKTNDPQGEYEYLGKISDYQGIDGTVLNWQGELYFLWSAYPNNTSYQQNIYIAHMSNPYTLDSERVLISSPTYFWEKKNGYVNEGPQVLIKNNTLHIIYSAPGVSLDYSLGRLTYKGGNLLSASSWEKYSQPVFESANGVYGPGHASFVKSPDGREDWIIYHAYTNVADVNNWNRNIRVQKFSWDGNYPVFGKPYATNTILKVPSGSIAQ